MSRKQSKRKVDETTESGDTRLSVSDKRRGRFDATQENTEEVLTPSETDHKRKKTKKAIERKVELKEEPQPELEHVTEENQPLQPLVEEAKEETREESKEESKYVEVSNPVTETYEEVNQLESKDVSHDTQETENKIQPHTLQTNETDSNQSEESKIRSVVPYNPMDHCVQLESEEEILKECRIKKDGTVCVTSFSASDRVLKEVLSYPSHELDPCEMEWKDMRVNPYYWRNKLSDVKFCLSDPPGENPKRRLLFVVNGRKTERLEFIPPPMKVNYAKAYSMHPYERPFGNLYNVNCPDEKHPAKEIKYAKRKIIYDLGGLGDSEELKIETEDFKKAMTNIQTDMWKFYCERGQNIKELRRMVGCPELDINKMSKEQMLMHIKEADEKLLDFKDMKSHLEKVKVPVFEGETGEWVLKTSTPCYLPYATEGNPEYTFSAAVSRVNAQGRLNGYSKVEIPVFNYVNTKQGIRRFQVPSNSKHICSNQVHVPIISLSMNDYLTEKVPSFKLLCYLSSIDIIGIAPRKSLIVLDVIKGVKPANTYGISYETAVHCTTPLSKGGASDLDVQINGIACQFAAPRAKKK